MNDTARQQWVDNDKYLRRLMRASGLPKRAFVRANRTRIDRSLDRWSKLHIEELANGGEQPPVTFFYH
jgi:hypothetical protein